MTNNVRKSNIELLRIITMLMIIAHHYAVHGVMHVGGGQAYTIFRAGTSINRLFTSLLSIGGQVGVGIFFIITGYFIIEKCKNRSILKICLQVIFYGWSMTILTLLLKAFGFKMSYVGFYSSILQYVLTPLSSNAWWFVTAYIILILFAPLLNSCVNKLNQKGYIALLVFLWLFLYTIDALYGGYWNLERALFFYFVGGYIRLYGRHTNRPSKMLILVVIIILWLFATFLSFHIGLYVDNHSVEHGSKGLKAIMFLFIGVLYPLLAISIFEFFYRLNIKHSNFINNIANTTFGVYLLHDNSYSVSLLWDSVLHVTPTQYFSKFYPMLAICSILAVFAGCSLIDMFRLRFIEPYLLNKANSLKVNLRNILLKK